MAVLLSLCLFASLALTACTNASNVSQKQTQHQTQQIANVGITYNAQPQDVLLRTFHAGGHLGTLNLTPLISIYGDGSYILGPSLQLHKGQLDQNALQQLLQTLVSTDGLLGLKRQQFYDIPDQDATLLQVALNGQSYTFLYGYFGSRQESQSDLQDYQHLGQALTTITQALSGPTKPYTSQAKALLVRQDFAPDLNATIPNWDFPDFTLNQLAIFECGAIPADETGPNGDLGCLTYDIPRNAQLLSGNQERAISELLHGHTSGEFYEPFTGLYYTVTLRPMLPDEQLQSKLAMYGSQNLDYTGVPLHQGPVPLPTPQP